MRNKVKFFALSAVILAILCCFNSIPEVFAQRNAEAKEAIDVAVVLSRNIAPYQSALDGFKEAMSSNGYRLNTVYYDLKGSFEEANFIITEIRQLGPNLILTIGTEATKALSDKVSDIPIVFSMALNSNLTKGRNLTGASMSVPIKSQLKELVAIIPSIRKVGIVSTTAYYTEHIAGVQRDISAEMNIEFISRFAKNEAEFTDAVRLILPEIDAFLFLPDEAILSPRTMQFVLLESARNNKPVVAPSLRFVQEGALLGLASDYKDIGRQSAELAIQVLQGKNAGELPATEARTTLLYLNQRTARQMGIPIPQGITSRADKIFE